MRVGLGSTKTKCDLVLKSRKKWNRCVKTANVDQIKNTTLSLNYASLKTSLFDNFQG